ncbi:MAG TPA: hypothetical protein VGR28_02210 [Candidatus Thermoplasmatota archaeon]|jgi:hypothetical protein|nr:hypothetical protein [Candidatus Thermoplasmatota archaeon]
MPPVWPRNELKVEGLDLDAVLREVSREMQQELKPMGPMLEFAIRENCVRKARIRLDGQRVRVEDAGDAYSLFDHADFAKVDFVEFEASRIMYIDRFEAKLQQAYDAVRAAKVS